MTTKTLNQKDGKHLIMNLYECSYLPNHSEIYDLLENIVKAVKMNALIPPYIVKGAEYNSGLTGFVIIETSHIAIHTFEETKFVAFDIYSCKNFDENKVIKLLVGLVKPKLEEKNVIRR